jgi:hypothetical protein
MNASVYIETSIVSYLTARPSRDLRAAACQNITAEWSDNRRSDFDVYISEIVVAEASLGNAEAAGRRLNAIDGIPELRISEEARSLARVMLQDGSLPPKAEVDALHIAVAAANGIDYLLTWNCAHIANAVMRPRIEQACRENGFEPPVICTPPELLGA